jgi:hypothetical protein
LPLALRAFRVTTFAGASGGALAMTEHPKTDTLLQQGPFATIAEAERFLHWYGTHEHHSSWDEERYEKAMALLIQADKEKHPDY